MADTSTTTTGVGGFLPEDYAQLVMRPVFAEGIAYQASTILRTDSHEVHFPIIDTDPAAGWTPEGTEISVADPTYAEVVATPAKVAAIHTITNEMVFDSNPVALGVAGASLKRSLINSIDGAFFAATTPTNAPDGLGALEGVQEISGELTSLDPFAEAITQVEGAGGIVTSFVLSRADLLTLLKLKDQADSNRILLGIDANQPTRRTALGVPVLATPALATGTAYAISRADTFVVTRNDATVEADRSVKFTSDQTVLRAIARVAFAFPAPARIARITFTTEPEA
jgi:HK97 family phage major capsid protein